VRVVVTGATGLLGRVLVEALRSGGEQVVAISRDPQRAAQTLSDEVEIHAWPDPTAIPAPGAALAGADAVVNLLGEPVAQNWTRHPEVRAEIRNSRILGTRSLVAGLRALPDERRPRVLVSQSAAGYYGHRGDQPLDEQAAPGTDFLAEVVVAWEQEALAAESLMRVAVTRTGVVLAAGGGALSRMLPFFRLGLGGPVAGGKQYVPWVHLDDVVGAIRFVLQTAEATGAVNVTAPNPVTNAELTKALGHALHRPAVLPVPALALRALYGEMSQIVTTGQRVIPSRLEQLGYAFRYTELGPALATVLGGA
jgi:uncharacterized protein